MRTPRTAGEPSVATTWNGLDPLDSDRHFPDETMHALLLLLSAVGPIAGPHPDSTELARWARHARAVTIVRDDWGIAHVHGKSDADAVFGMIYAQAEDDFNRVETNFINAMGRLAEAEGESQIYRDLRMTPFIDADTRRKDYAASPQWLK